MDTGSLGKHTEPRGIGTGSPGNDTEPRGIGNSARGKHRRTKVRILWLPVSIGGSKYGYRVSR